VDRASFVSDRLGVVRRTTAGYDAFFPAALPRTVELGAATLRLLTDATGALHRLAGVGQLLPDPAIGVGAAVRIESISSSRIEGTRTDVDQLLRHESRGDAGAPPQGDLLEVVNHVRAAEHALTSLGRLPLSLRLLRETYGVLMRGVRGETMTPGEFRRSRNWIGHPGATLSTTRFVPPPVDAMHAALADLESFVHERELPDLVTAALAHYQFEAIHPFVDGNGRIGRLLVAMILAERRVLTRPVLSLSSYLERHRERYIELLFTTSATGELTPWLDFFLTGVVEQAGVSERRTSRLVDIARDLETRLTTAGVSATALRLAAAIIERPYVTAPEVARLLDVTPPTARKAITDLARLGVLTEVTGKQRNRVWVAPDVLAAIADTQ
jgi:Fic family protein